MILGLHHAQITIPQNAEEEARRFYCGLLKLTEIPKPATLEGRGGFWLQAGNHQVHIGTEDGVNRNDTKAHLAYHVSDLACWEERLRDNDVTLLKSIPIPGYQRFEFRDPFGNRVEMIMQEG